MAYNKFILIGQARTGTTYLQTLLDSHRQIVSCGEVFHLLVKQRHDPVGLDEIINDPIGYINKHVYGSYPGHVRAVGHKLLYSQIGSDSAFLKEMETDDVAPSTKKRRERFSRFMRAKYDLAEARRRFAGYLEYLKDSLEFRVIHLVRANKLETFLSERLASKSGTWTSSSGPYLPGATHLDPKACLEFFERVDALEREYDSLFGEHELLELSYEELVRDAGSSLGMVQDFLGVERTALSSPLKKQNRFRVSDAISNYSELKESLEGTKWIKYFQ